jgi:hypothetical protein
MAKIPAKATQKGSQFRTRLMIACGMLGLSIAISQVSCSRKTGPVGESNGWGQQSVHDEPARRGGEPAPGDIREVSRPDVPALKVSEVGGARARAFQGRAGSLPSPMLTMRDMKQEKALQSLQVQTSARQ